MISHSYGGCIFFSGSTLGVTHEGLTYGEGQRNAPSQRCFFLIFKLKKCRILWIFIAKNYLWPETAGPGGLVDPLGVEDIKCMGMGWIFSRGSTSTPPVSSHPA